MKRTLSVVVGLMVVVGAQAVSITHGNTTITMEFVNIGHINNASDSTGYGTVNYGYRIGKHAVTVGQYMAARAADNRISDGDENFWNDGTRTVGTGAPLSMLSAFEAMKFSNWLTSGDAYDGAYQFDSYGLLTAVDRDAALADFGMVYVLPTEDEWYKTAYFKPDASDYSIYANGSDDVADLTRGTASGWNYANDLGQFVNSPPNNVWETGFGAEEQNGTYNMMGNVWEWTESALDGELDSMWEQRTIRGGSFSTGESRLRSSYRLGGGASQEYTDISFRIVAIPEPSSIAMISLVSGSAVFIRRTFMI